MAKKAKKTTKKAKTTILTEKVIKTVPTDVMESIIDQAVPVKMSKYEEAQAFINEMDALGLEGEGDKVFRKMDTNILEANIDAKSLVDRINKELGNESHVMLSPDLALLIRKIKKGGE